MPHYGPARHRLNLTTSDSAASDGPSPRSRNPPSSVLLYEFSDVGLLEGNGNHCDYLAAQYRETDQFPEEVLHHYANSRVRRVDPSYESGFRTHVPVYIEFPETQRSDIAHLTDASTLAVVHSKRSRKTLYLVYSIDVGYPPNFDWRCF